MRLTDVIPITCVILLGLSIVYESAICAIFPVGWIGWWLFQFVSEYGRIRDELYKRAKSDDTSDVLFP